MNFIDEDAAKLAGLQIDMLQKLRRQQMTLAQFEWFNNLTLTEREALVCGEIASVVNHTGPLALHSLEVVATRRLNVLVDYTAPIKKQLKAGGYDNDIPDLTTAKFTGQGKAEQEILFYQFSVGPESDEVEAFFKANNLIPAGVYHAAAVGRDHPDLQRKIGMVFLGDVWPSLDGGVVGVLIGDSGDRSFHLGPRQGGWDQHRWFAAVRA